MKPKEAEDLMDRMNRLLAKLEDRDLKKALGRPRSTQRCACGAMTAYRAQKRRHVCEAKEMTE